MGQQVRTVYNGPSAIEAARAFKPDLILLDIGMPNVSGYAVAHALYTETRTSKPILVAVTGWGQDADKQQAKEAGFHYHFVKPVAEGHLRSILAEVSASKDTAMQIGRQL